MIPEYRLGHLQRALGHRYSFEAFLGRGAFASVLLVRNLKLGRHEALKVLQESYDGDHEFAKRFVEEAKLVASLDHPNIVKVYDYGEVDGVLWYSMQYIAGPSLGAELEARKPLEHQEVVSLAVPLLDALSYSHAAGVVHRDVKPGNIMISKRGQPYLMDFGIAKVKDGGFKTATGSVLGTPAYISPEQASGETVDGRSDVYSLGVCLYQLIAGVLPFPASDPIRMLLRRLSEDPEPLVTHQPGVDQELASIVLKSLARSTEDRFQSAAEMRDRLLSSFRHQVDVAAVRVTVKIEQPAPLKKASSAQAALPTSSTPPTILEPSEAPTIISTATPSATQGDHQRGKRLPIVLAILAALTLGGYFILKSEGPEPPLATAADPSTITPAEGAPPDASASANEAQGLEDAPQAEDSTLDETGNAQTKLDDVTEANSDVEDAPELPSPASSRPAPPAQSEATRKTPPGAPPSSAPPPPRPRQVVVPPAILEAPNIELDAETAEACSAQEVILTASIDAAGELISSRALVSPSDTCQAAALEHVKRYKFRPGRDFEDEAVASKLTFSIQFP